ncbi:Fe-S cluster assembly sulfur transfer protein SufU [Thiorhodospira sibirica]|uniref:Fe-S cluster assembly sulfur transfer protein SufU n=1 Tax=Thiorhodospira sibirica TaxID=154347 RepID=UPI00022C17A3|nr:SUF system NifU family Fe-S cluster assembly protein [Thiorhodospira sibirica]
MHNELNDLYQELILDHKRHPRNFRDMPDATRAVDGHNPLCGDQLRIYVRLHEGLIEDVSFLGAGCAISIASASMLTEALKGQSIETAQALFGQMHDMLTNDQSTVDPGSLGKLGVLSGVRDYPSRVKCASLCWHTLKAALDGDKDTISTE